MLSSVKEDVFLLLNLLPLKSQICELRQTKRQTRNPCRRR